MLENCVWKTRDISILSEMHQGMMQDRLRVLVNDQRQELEACLLPPIAGESALSWYKQSGLFGDLYQEALNFYTLPHTKEETGDFNKRLAGRVYQDIAFYFLASIQSDSCVLLSPERTLKFYSGLHPDALPVEHEFGLNSLNVSVPDGLLVGKGNQVLAVCEYTLRMDQEKLKKREERLRLEKERFPNLFPPEAYLLLVLAKSLGSADIDFQPAYFDTKRFGAFIEDLCVSYRSKDDSATIVEVQRRARQQLEKGRLYEREGILTPEYSRFLAKVG